MLFLLLFITVSCDKNETSEDSINNFSSMKDGLITLKSGAVVEKEGDVFYFEGDMILSEQQLKDLDEKGDFITKSFNENDDEVNIHPLYNIPFEVGEDNSVIPRAFGIYPTPYNTWAMVRFVYSENLTSDRKAIIKKALHHWEAKTNVRFYNATDEPTEHPIYKFKYPYIEFVNSTKNSSSVGRIGERQVVNLARFQPTSAAIHEIGHAIGLRHEQNRADRDNYIKINLSNVSSNNRHNYNKVTKNYYSVGSIDYKSIMMYGSKDFAINNSIPVMTKKSDGSTWTGGSVLSDLDRKWANTIYKPYIARSDVYAELAPIVYKPDNTIMTPRERLAFQAQLNRRNRRSTPPDCCRLPNEF